MRRRVAVMLGTLLVLGGVGLVGQAAEAHTCDSNGENCEETPVMDNWRDNYVPLFDLEDRDDEAQRYDAQRWRDECHNGTQYRQQCAWAYGGTSAFQDGEPTADGSPNEAHSGFAATHCFLFEFAHNCEDHNRPADEDGDFEGAHDAHGGATYADVCLTANPESKYCDDGLSDTQVGVTIMDHNPCGLLIPVASCTDEYHVVRPADTEYTQAQMEDTAAWPERTLADPASYICGKRNHATPCVDFVNTVWDLLPLP